MNLLDLSRSQLVVCPKVSLNLFEEKLNQEKADFSTFLWYVVPGFNEESRLYGTLDYLQSLQPSLKKNGLEMVIILVDDGSSDNTYKIMKQFADKTGNFAKRINHGGRGSALQAGVRLVREVSRNVKNPGIIAFSAADLKLPLRDFTDSQRYILHKGWTGVFLSKNLSDSLMKRSSSRKLMSFCYNRIVRLLFNFEYMDTQGVKFLQLNEEMFSILESCTDKAFIYDTEVAVKLSLNNMAIKELPYHAEESSEKDSKVNFSATLIMIFGLMKLFRRIGIQRVQRFFLKIKIKK
jgi:glycosyltransferase involved in cell wall biosynthesis